MSSIIYNNSIQNLVSLQSEATNTISSLISRGIFFQEDIDLAECIGNIFSFGLTACGIMILIYYIFFERNAIHKIKATKFLFVGIGIGIATITIYGKLRLLDQLKKRFTAYTIYLPTSHICKEETVDKLYASLATLEHNPEEIKNIILNGIDHKD